MYPNLYSLNNLILACKKAAKGKRGHQIVAEFEYYLEDNLVALHKELKDDTYLPGSYTNFYIHEPKRRLISAAPFRDRVVHHALCNLIEPIFERSFIYDSYANRVGKGTHRARARAQQFARTYRYVLPLDVVQFFPDIDHKTLNRELFKKVTDLRVQRLIGLILESGEQIHGTSQGRAKGLPIGNLTSQFWANVHMNPIDHFIKRTLRCPGYVRYVDDLLLFSDSKHQLHEWKERVAESLERRYLSIHAGAHPKPVTEGIPFLGFVIFPDRIRLKRRKGVHFRRKLKRLIADGADYDTVLASVNGWLNHTRYGNTRSLQKAVLFDLGLQDLYYDILEKPTKDQPVSLRLFVYTNEIYDDPYQYNP